MTDIVLSQEDINAADAFLTQFLQDNVPEGDFTEGSALRDLTVGALAMVYAFLQKENETTRAGQSLRLLETLEDDIDTTEMTDQILSNWFLSRRSGQYNHGPLVLHFSSNSDVTIPASTRFFRTSSQIYVPDTGGVDIVIPGAQLIPEFSADGELVNYRTTIQVRAATVDASTITPSRWLGADSFSSTFTYASNEESFSAGSLSESNEEFIARAGDAISTRNLINDRSIRATLVETFPTIKDIFVAKMSSVEMRRDLIERIGRASAIHVGGHMDIYVDLPTTLVEEVLEVGAYYARPDGKAVWFKDAGIPDFWAAGVRPGHVLNVISGLPEAPIQFIITGVEPGYITVSDRFPFSGVTDTTANTLQYSIGELSPAFSDKVAARYTTGSNDGTSATRRNDGRVTLQARPILAITRVDIPADDEVFTLRTNQQPQGLLAEEKEYRLVTENPLYAQSSSAVTELEVGLVSNPTEYDTKLLRVQYVTYSGFAGVDTFVNDTQQRVNNSNSLVRGFNYADLSMVIRYRLLRTATTTLNEEAARTLLVNYIRDFEAEDVLDVSDIVAVLRGEYPQLGMIEPFEIDYYFGSPDGQYLRYLTSNAVSIFPDEFNGASFENGAELETPITTSTELSEYLKELGVTDNTIKYYALSSNIRFVNATNS